MTAFTVVGASAPPGQPLVNVQLQAPRQEDGTEGSMSLNVPIAQAAEFIVGTVYEVTFKPAKP